MRPVAPHGAGARRTPLRWPAALAVGLLLAAPLLPQESAPAADAEAPQEEVPPLAWEEPGREEPEEEPAESPEPAPEAAEPEAEELERITFEIPFPPEKGGGVARGSAGSLEYVRQDYLVATDAVELSFQDLKFQGEQVEVDLSTKIVTASGGVIVDQGPQRLVGETLVYDLESKTGKVTQAEAFVDPDIFFRGAEIEKLGEDVYALTDGVLTSCSAEVPAWSFRLGRARIEVDGYARARNSTMRVKKLPFLYAPYLRWPTRRDRKSGLLFPNIGYSDRRGYLFGLAYYQTLGDSYDATLFSELYGQEFLGLGTEFRYRPSQGTGGVVRAYAIDDPESNEVRWKATIDHVSDNLPFGMRGVVRFIDYSDFDFFQDFERDFNEISIRRLRSTGFVTGSWGNHSFNLVLEENQTFVSNGVIRNQRQLPELEYKLRPTRLGPLPIYAGLDSALHYFTNSVTGAESDSWGRADLAPSLTVPLSYWTWLSASVTGGARFTWYEDSLTPDRQGFSGESLTRTLPFATSQIIGPSFSRIFDRKIGAFGKFKHIIEPRWGYAYVDEFDDQPLIPIFDEVDTVRGRNIASIALVNRLLAKPADPESLVGAREILTFELSQLFSLDDDAPLQSSRDGTLTRKASAIAGRLRFQPGRRTNLESRVSYNTLFGQLQSASLSGGTEFGPHAAGVSWYTRFDPELKDTTTHQARVFTGIQLIPARLRIDSQVNYDFNLKLLQQQRHVIQFVAQCWDLRLELAEKKSLNRRDREYRFALSLKNVGTFLDLNGATRENL